jgi:hypothetical protein
MTSATKIAAILKKLGDAHYQAADELLAIAGESASGPERPASAGAAAPPVAAPATIPPSCDELPPEEWADEGSEAICPAHHKPFVDGKFGPYCPGKGIDPAWTNKRGYCTVNPKNVATYLRVKAAA